MLELSQNFKRLDQNARRCEGPSHGVHIIVSVREIHGRKKSGFKQRVRYPHGIGTDRSHGMEIFYHCGSR